MIKEKKLVSVTLTEDQALFLCACYNLGVASTQNNYPIILESSALLRRILTDPTTNKEELKALLSIVDNIAESLGG